MNRTTAYFEKGGLVKIIEGEHSGEIGIINEITNRDILPKFRRYEVCTVSEPSGFLINETMLEELYEDDFKLLDKTPYKGNHLFSEFAAVKGGFNSIKLGVYEDEGQIPHFHFYKNRAPEKGIPKDARSGGGCICFMSPNYFIHEGHKETMDKKEIKGLIEFLNKKHEGLNITNWEYMITTWNNNNDDSPQVPIDTKIPEYTHNMKTIQDKKK